MSFQEEPKPTIQIRIRDLRRDRRLTQEELADALGISRQSINAMEAGRTLPSLPMALQIAQYFSVPLNSVFLVEVLNDGTLLPVIASAYEPTERASSVNLWETDRAYFVEFLVPGLRQEDLQLDVGEDSLTLEALAPRVTTDCRIISREFGSPTFSRTVKLPSAVRSEGARGQLQAGILRVLLPKLVSPLQQRTRIEISSID